MPEKEIYLLAGLGFDKRIFQNLNFSSGNINYLDWLEPEKNENLNNYVQRIFKQIKTTESNVILIGHSFGGIIVQKIAELIQTSKVIIISSIKSKEEIPVTLRFLKLIPLYKFFNKKIILQTFPIWARAFGYNSEKGRNLFIQMISSCTDNYFKWALDIIVNYDERNQISNIAHIHGNRDKTFPIKRIRNPIIIEDGSHFMVFSKAEEVSEVLNREIQLL